MTAHPGSGNISRLKTLMVAFTSILSLTACESVQTARVRGGDKVDTKTVMPVPSQRAPAPTGTATGLLMAYGFEGAQNVVGKSGCRWRLVNRDTRESFFVDLNAKGGTVFTNLSPGRYETGRFGCGIGRVWDLEGIFKNGFQVQAGNVSYVGKLVFVFNKKAFEEVRKPSRTDSAQAFLDAQKALPAGATVISAFTLQSINAEMAQAGSTGGGFEAFGQGLDDGGKSLDPLLGQLKACESSVSQTDPLRFGRLEYVAAFSKGQFKEFKDRKDNNAFPDAFRDCVTARLTEFRPTTQSDLEIRITY